MASKTKAYARLLFRVLSVEKDELVLDLGNDSRLVPTLIEHEGITWRYA